MAVIAIPLFKGRMNKISDPDYLMLIKGEAHCNAPKQPAKNNSHYYFMQQVELTGYARFVYYQLLSPLVDNFFQQGVDITGFFGVAELFTQLNSFIN